MLVSVTFVKVTKTRFFVKKLRKKLHWPSALNRKYNYTHSAAMKDHFSHKKSNE